MKNKFLILFTLLMVVLLGGCADHANTIVLCATDCHTYGFWGGLWHGIIAPFDFIGMLIWDDVTLYAQNNNGAWYAFGFCWGSGIIFGGGVTASGKARKR